jgi:hypothetical protein
LLAVDVMSRSTAKALSLFLALAAAGCGGKDPADSRDGSVAPDAAGRDRVGGEPSPVDSPAGPRSTDGGLDARPAGGDASVPDGGTDGSGGGDVRGEGGGGSDGESGADAGPVFAGCPGATAYAGNPAWRDALTIAAPAPVLCAYWEQSDGSLDPNSTENRLRSTLARKAMATIAPGRYPLLDADGQADLTLPLCLVPREGQPLSIGPGTVERGPFNNYRVFTLSFPVPDQGVLMMRQLGFGPAPFAFKSLGDLQLCVDRACNPGQLTPFTDCAFTGPTERKTVNLDSGTVELTVTYDTRGIGAGTEPATFVSARGTFRGVAFDQRDYFKLVYSPENHHFTQHFAVFFDTPIEGACGLEIVNVTDSPAARRRPRAWTTDCKLTRLTEVPVTNVATAGPPIGPETRWPAR